MNKIDELIKQIKAADAILVGVVVEYLMPQGWIFGIQLTVPFFKSTLVIFIKNIISTAFFKVITTTLIV